MIKRTTPTFFIDRALGRQAVANALRSADIHVEIHDDHFPSNAKDTEWLPVIGERGWLILTKDDKIGRNILEQLAIANAKARVFVLTQGKLTGPEMAQIFVTAAPKIEKFAQGNKAPFIAKVFKTGMVRKWQTDKQLLKLLKYHTQS